ncbi:MULTISPECIES: DeoR/GlpR family DNA-binding transcription regulator [Vagococcus]|uniref:Transcriptional repressor of the fructose operon, DeoR family n=1 Tax=Vagococcus fluvialis bH819 TaxID=1255619 RepID=A0A1X6WQ64_9ENTE|nr:MULTISPECIES: DeoR/GlpR family DNA-binding transcription regulator [Vagococcus]SLM86419.1 Transcriptional repressor of the fructose operon, DeoR family [Vagococcus fluvialis bH819]HCM90627.1 DeoR/GlpR transcriptional regulator [Vagococcus sp.]
MRSSVKTINLRMNKILDLLQEHGQLTTDELAELLTTSISTVRRDLITLEEKNEIIRKHGFCLYNFKNRDNFDESGPERLKAMIGAKAAELISNNDSVFINTSSTSLNSIKYTKATNLTIISNNLKLASLKLDPQSSYILTGGELRVPKESLVGDIAFNTINDMNADICIIGCSGVDIQHGVTTKILNEAKINKAMIEKTTKIKVLVADHRKIGLISNFKISDLTVFDYLITDEYASSTIIKEYSKLGLKIIQVSGI